MRAVLGWLVVAALVAWWVSRLLWPDRDCGLCHGRGRFTHTTWVAGRTVSRRCPLCSGGRRSRRRSKRRKK